MATRIIGSATGYNHDYTRGGYHAIRKNSPASRKVHTKYNCEVQSIDSTPLRNYRKINKHSQIVSSGDTMKRDVMHNESLCWSTQEESNLFKSSPRSVFNVEKYITSPTVFNNREVLGADSIKQRLDNNQSKFQFTKEFYDRVAIRKG